MRDTSRRALPAVALFSRRHIDFARTAGALCPGA
ncbi:putative leader peptide [Streptomyces sp. NPDC020917]